MGDKSPKKKQGFFQKLFSSKPRDGENDDDDREKTHKHEPPSRSNSGGGSGSRDGKEKGKMGSGPKKSLVPSVKVDPPPDEHRRPSSAKKSPMTSSSSGVASSKKPPGHVRDQRPSYSAPPKGQRSTSGLKPKRLSRKKTKKGVKGDIAPADPNQRLEFPTTPEMILAIHKRKPFLDKNEEWLVVELNEYECLVETLDIIKVIANHSKFFEVEPDELWEEFFEYVEDMPSYDEVINYDVWQEFRDEKYPC